MFTTSQRQHQGCFQMFTVNQHPVCCQMCKFFVSCVIGFLRSRCFISSCGCTCEGTDTCCRSWKQCVHYRARVTSCGRSRGVAKFVCAVVHDALKSRGKRGIFDGTGSFRCLRCDVATCSPCLAQSVQSGAARSLVGPVIAWEKQSRQRHFAGIYEETGFGGNF